MTHSKASLCPGSPRVTLSKITALNVVTSERGASTGAERVTCAWLQAYLCSRHLTFNVNTETHDVRRKALHNNRVAAWIELNNWPRKRRKKKRRDCTGVNYYHTVRSVNCRHSYRSLKKY